MANDNSVIPFWPIFLALFFLTFIIYSPLFYLKFTFIFFLNAVIAMLNATAWHATDAQAAPFTPICGIGTNIKFKIENLDQYIDVFTSRIDTIYGATFIALSPKHKLVDLLTDKTKIEEVKKYIEEYNKLSDRDIKKDIKNKTGVFLGKYAINPVNNKKIPIYIIKENSNV